MTKIHYTLETEVSLVQCVLCFVANP